ncbi:hypothetical protein Tco_0296038 [Tanacetum coccineum]
MDTLSPCLWTLVVAMISSKPCLVSLLHFTFDSQPSFLVMISNGTFLHCTGQCPNINLRLSDTSFSISTYVFPIEGDDAVLQLTFNHLGKEVTLRGESSPKFGTSTDLADKVVVQQEGIDTNRLKFVDAKAGPSHEPISPALPTDSEYLRSAECRILKIHVLRKQAGVSGLRGCEPLVCDLEIADKLDKDSRYAEFFEKRLISQEISRRAVDLEEIQEEEDTITFEKLLATVPQDGVRVLLNHPQPPQDRNVDSKSNSWIDAMKAGYTIHVWDNMEAELRVDFLLQFWFEIDINDMKSLTGYVSFLNGSAVGLEAQMAIPVQNINHSAFRSMFEKEKLSGNNFNDWFARLKLVLRVEKKMHVFEQPLPPAPEAGAELKQKTTLWLSGQIYMMLFTEIAFLMLGVMTMNLH